MAEGGVTNAERVELLDALRGFALFGILLANILYWSGWIFLQPEQRLALAGADSAAAQYLFHHTFVDGKFYTIFSLLFGIGFSLQLRRLEDRDLDEPRIFRRRLLILLAIGLIHMVLVWDGDILTFYALIGLLLPLFRKWGDRSLLFATAILIFLVPYFGHAIFEALGWRPHEAVADFGNRTFAALGGNPADPIGWMRRSDPYAFFAWVISGWPFAISTRLESWRIPKLLGIMLLGLLLGRRLADGKFLNDRRLLWWTFGIGLALGLPLSLVYGLTPNLGR